MERWLPVVGFEIRYEVSDLGRVKSLSRRVPCKGGSRLLRERILKAKPGSCGRLEISLGKGNSRRVHSLVLEAFVGPCPEGMQGCHWDGDAQNNCLKNLRWDTPQGNADDKTRHGRNPRGERHGNAKLTRGAVTEIRCWRKAGVSARQLSMWYGVGETAILLVSRGETWR